MEAKYYDAALCLIDRTRFRSGCDALEGTRVFGSPLQHDALSLPVVDKNELILMLWIYPKYSWVFPITHESKKLTPKKVITTTRKGPPIRYDLNTEWNKHFRIILDQTQCAIDAFEEEIESAKKIVLIPHGTSLQTPFAALKHPHTKEFLFQTHELQVSPSLRYFTITDNRPKINARKHLVIGDPTGNLPDARKEAEVISKRLGCTPIMGQDATKDLFLSTLSDTEFGIIHYAGHGSYTPDGLQSLVFSDGPVTADDINSIQFSANIVNIASCWSGMTEFSVWNELHGFIRALLISGVRNVISSTYPLGDEASLCFNGAFYDQYFDKSQRPSKAFQIALSSIPAHFPVELWGGLSLIGQR